MVIQWYPGHMVKTKRQIQESLKLIDVIIEILDSRIPESSKNPDLDKLISDKPKVVLLNKCDLAQDSVTKEWIKYYRSKGITALEIDSITGKNINKVYNAVKVATSEKFEKKAAKGIVGRPVRALVAGIPNVGKSSFINKISSKSNAQTGDKPGVTKNKQWIKVNKDFELMDTPGILWPKFDDEKVAYHLAFTRAIKDEILDPEELSVKLIEELMNKDKDIIIKRYNVDVLKDAYETLKMIGKKRGCMVSGGGIDTQRAAILILDDFRSGKLGKITLEYPTSESIVEES
ncbi:GTPase YlqF [Fervidicella metallireducens AeB]|uniref:Ribosome biogenesis GTPase A n=1 Tax=Fervidicella metallireducens AeB TaxID=1403537 RepID=A0A017RX16_9CLOT|nr:ribosome biogenesis GTPase YlqF [Fervidicella metallireducens]EYE89323.1 GTPase YlqF [Fervidicella metallireducens AeB]